MPMSNRSHFGDPGVNLKGLTVLVTRPTEQATPLCQAIASAAGHAIHYPTIEIVPTPCSTELNPATADIAIFISRNAVRCALENFPQLPNSSLTTVTVGQGTADEYHKMTGHPVDFVPHQHFNSEGLLALPALAAVKGKRIVLFKGEGGRTKIESELNRRGANIIPMVLYRRAIPTNPSPVNWSIVDIIITTSNMALQNLWTMTPATERTALLAKPLVVISTRGKRLARQLGFNYHPVLALSADSASLIQLLQEWQMKNAVNNDTQ